MSGNDETAVWGIHAGRTGDADEQFLKGSCIALGWAGDLSGLKADREAFKAHITERYPETKPAAIPQSAGQLFRFLYEMKRGDLVVYPSKRDRQIHLGRVEGDYRYDSKASYPQVRTVKWLRRFLAPNSAKERCTKLARR